MRATVYVGVSVDGFLARPDGGLDFLEMGKAASRENYGYDQIIGSVDAHVIGRKTFDQVLTLGGWPYGEKPVVVLTHHPGRLKIPPGARCEAMKGSPRNVASRLSRRGWRRIYVDGGETLQGFLKAGLVDRLIVSRVPVLIGQGVPLFGALPRDIHLKHVATRAYRSGLVKTEYRVLSR